MATKKKTTKKTPAKKKAPGKKTTRKASGKKTAAPAITQKACAAYLAAEKQLKAAEAKLKKAWDAVAACRADKAKAMTALGTAKTAVAKHGETAEKVLGRKIKHLRPIKR